MEKGRIEFAISILEPGGNSEQNGNVQIFVYIRQFHYGAKPASKPVSQWAYSYIGLFLNLKGTFWLTDCRPAKWTYRILVVAKK